MIDHGEQPPQPKVKVSLGGLQKPIPAIGKGRGLASTSSTAFKDANDRVAGAARLKGSLLDSEDDEDKDEVLARSDKGSASTNGHGNITSIGSKGSSQQSQSQSQSHRLLGVAGAAPSSRAARERQEKALEVDATIFDYDGVYDSMKVGEREALRQRDIEKQKRDPKYMQASLAASEQRRLDRQRADARKIQREREQEGDEFAGTEAFVTDAYKKQMLEMQEAEEKDKTKEELDRKKSRGVAGFYKDILADQDKAHQAAVKASTSAAMKEEAHSNPTKQDETEEQRRRLRVDQARKKGLDVRINDDNEVVDERSLLSAGLNTFGKRKHNNTTSEDDSEEAWQARQQHLPSSRSLGRGEDGQREAREAREAQRRRQSKLIEEQMLTIQRQREEEEREQAQERKRAIIGQRRNDANSIAEARRRALERRKEREKEDGVSS